MTTTIPTITDPIPAMAKEATQAHEAAVELFAQLAEVLRKREMLWAALGHPAKGFHWTGTVRPNLMELENTLQALGQLLAAYPNEDRMVRGATELRAQMIARQEKAAAEAEANKAKLEAANAANLARIQKSLDAAQARRDAL